METSTPENPLLPLQVPLILASASPRRTELLRRIRIPHQVVVSPYEEEIPAHTSDPGALTERLAMEKGLPVAQAHPHALVLSADTLVVLDNQVLGKPRTPGEAATMLRLLSNRFHHVYTGICVTHQASGRVYTCHECTRVFFDALSDEEINTYVQTGSPMDKAGAYGIQDDLGALFIKRIEGDYYNVVGLPLHRLYRILQDAFSDLLAQDNVSGAIRTEQ